MDTNRFKQTIEYPDYRTVMKPRQGAPIRDISAPRHPHQAGPAPAQGMPRRQTPAHLRPGHHQPTAAVHHVPVQAAENHEQYKAQVGHQNGLQRPLEAQDNTISIRLSVPQFELPRRINELRKNPRRLLLYGFIFLAIFTIGYQSGRRTAYPPQPEVTAAPTSQLKGQG